MAGEVYGPPAPETGFWGQFVDTAIGGFKVYTDWDLAKTTSDLNAINQQAELDYQRSIAPVNFAASQNSQLFVIGGVVLVAVVLLLALKK